MSAEINQMVEVHLLNVQRELETLKNRALEIQAEQERLTAYLNDGAKTLENFKQQQQPEQQQPEQGSPATKYQNQLLNP